MIDIVYHQNAFLFEDSFKWFGLMCDNTYDEKLNVLNGTIYF